MSQHNVSTPPGGVRAGCGRHATEPDAPPVMPPSPGHMALAPVDVSLGLPAISTEPLPTPLGQGAEPRVKSEGLPAHAEELGGDPPPAPSTTSRDGYRGSLPTSEHKDPYVEPGSLTDLVARLTPQQVADEVARLVALNAEHALKAFGVRPAAWPRSRSVPYTL